MLLHTFLKIQHQYLRKIKKHIKIVFIKTTSADAEIGQQGLDPGKSRQLLQFLSVGCFVAFAICEI